MPQLSYLTAVFNLPLRGRDIHRWRSAWSEMAGFEMDRFHNHKPGNEGVIYRYPLVQYRVREGKAALLALDQATDDVQQALSVGPWEIVWNYDKHPIELEDLSLEQYELSLDRQFYHYRLRAYLPFNDSNFERWKSTTGLVKRIQLIERMLAGHLLNFATGIDWQIPERFEVEVMDLGEPYLRPLHEIMRPAFDLEFKTNLVLPFGIGLGKGVSHGYGVLLPPK